MPTQPQDFDALLGPKIAEAAEATKFFPVTLFGQTFRVTTSPNVFTSLVGGTGDPQAISKLITTMIHTEDRQAFQVALMDSDGITAEVLLELLNMLLEAAAERPTKSPSVSSRGTKSTRARVAKSAPAS